MESIEVIRDEAQNAHRIGMLALAASTLTGLVSISELLNLPHITVPEYLIAVGAGAVCLGMGLTCVDKLREYVRKEAAADYFERTQ